MSSSVWLSHLQPAAFCNLPQPTVSQAVSHLLGPAKQLQNKASAHLPSLPSPSNAASSTSNIPAECASLDLKTCYKMLSCLVKKTFQSSSHSAVLLHVPLMPPPSSYCANRSQAKGHAQAMVSKNALIHNCAERLSNGSLASWLLSQELDNQQRQTCLELGLQRKLSTSDPKLKR